MRHCNLTTWRKVRLYWNQYPVKTAQPCRNNQSNLKTLPNTVLSCRAHNSNRTHPEQEKVWTNKIQQELSVRSITPSCDRSRTWKQFKLTWIDIWLLKVSLPRGFIFIEMKCVTLTFARFYGKGSLLSSSAQKLWAVNFNFMLPNVCRLNLSTQTPTKCLYWPIKGRLNIATLSW